MPFFVRVLRGGRGRHAQRLRILHTSARASIQRARCQPALSPVQQQPGSPSTADSLSWIMGACGLPQALDGSQVTSYACTQCPSSSLKQLYYTMNQATSTRKTARHTCSTADRATSCTPITTADRLQSYPTPLPAPPPRRSLLRGHTRRSSARSDPKTFFYSTHAALPGRTKSLRLELLLLWEGVDPLKSQVIHVHTSTNKHGQSGVTHAASPLLLAAARAVAVRCQLARARRAGRQQYKPMGSENA